MSFGPPKITLPPAPPPQAQQTAPVMGQQAQGQRQQKIAQPTPAPTFLGTGGGGVVPFSNQGYKTLLGQ